MPIQSTTANTGAWLTFTYISFGVAAAMHVLEDLAAPARDHETVDDDRRVVKLAVGHSVPPGISVSIVARHTQRRKAPTR